MAHTKDTSQISLHVRLFVEISQSKLFLNQALSHTVNELDGIDNQVDEPAKPLFFTRISLIDTMFVQCSRIAQVSINIVEIKARNERSSSTKLMPYKLPAFS